MADAVNPETSRPPSYKRRLLFYLALAALVTSPCWGLPIFCLSLSAFWEWRDRIPFDPEVWKATDDTKIRYHMSWDLIHSNILKGKSPTEVEVLLGKPWTKDVFSDNPTMPKFSTPHFERGVETWYYSLGGEMYEFSIGPSGAVLAVDFKDGKVFDIRKVIH